MNFATYSCYDHRSVGGEGTGAVRHKTTYLFHRGFHNSFCAVLPIHVLVKHRQLTCKSNHYISKARHGQIALQLFDKIGLQRSLALLQCPHGARDELSNNIDRTQIHTKSFQLRNTVVIWGSVKMGLTAEDEIKGTTNARLTFSNRDRYPSSLMINSVTS
jgi:hypothetical protein